MCVVGGGCCGGCRRVGGFGAGVCEGVVVVSGDGCVSGGLMAWCARDGRAGRGSGGGQDPSSGEVQAAVDEVAQVEGGGATPEPCVVIGGAPVAQLEASPASAGDLGDDAFDVGSGSPVAVAQLGVVLPVAAGLTQQVVVFMQDDLPAGLGRGALGA